MKLTASNVVGWPIGCRVFFGNGKHQTVKKYSFSHTGELFFPPAEMMK
ncbi:hypothetical protein YPPY54_1521 [Yersinia pestis PY-54]|nr:hypothetical protein YPPY54_1521 [Yersinia pestis PY-54]